MNTAPIISKVWSFCTTLRDDGVSYGDYLEQLTYLIFLKMADEYAKPPYNRDVGIPDGYDWQSLKSKRGAELERHYIELLRDLADFIKCYKPENRHKRKPTWGTPTRIRRAAGAEHVG